MFNNTTICLFAIKNMCNQFNDVTLTSIEQLDIRLNAVDEIDYPRYLRKRANSVRKEKTRMILHQLTVMLLPSK